MNDFNFFRAYLPKEDDKVFKKVSVVASLILSLFIIGSFTYYKVNIFVLEKKINEINSKMNEQTFIEKENEICIMKNKENVLENYSKETKEIKEKIDGCKILTPELIDEINSAKSKEIKFMYFDLSKNILSIKGKSDDRLKVAEFEGNLKDNQKFQNIHVLNILNNAEGDESSFDFEIKCSLKDVDDYETK